MKAENFPSARATMSWRAARPGSGVVSVSAIRDAPPPPGSASSCHRGPRRGSVPPVRTGRRAGSHRDDLARTARNSRCRCRAGHRARPGDSRSAACASIASRTRSLRHGCTGPGALGKILFDAGFGERRGFSATRGITGVFPAPMMRRSVFPAISVTRDAGFGEGRGEPGFFLPRFSGLQSGRPPRRQPPCNVDRQPRAVGPGRAAICSRSHRYPAANGSQPSQRRPWMRYSPCVVARR
ncbi:hypothetical protein BH10PSE6_BH10PSE6_34470 [soil metagenome]